MADETPTVVSEDSELTKLTNGLLFALMTGGSAPYPIPVQEASSMAALLLRCGWVQGEPVEAVELPSWITDRVREQSSADEVSAAPDSHAVQETPLVSEAPPPPAVIPSDLVGSVTGSLV